MTQPPPTPTTHPTHTEAVADAAASVISGANVTTYPLAADLLADQLDIATLKGVDERKRLNLLRTFLPPATWAARPTEPLLMAIARTERAIEKADALCDDIRGAIGKLLTA